jgi:pimeloyl-ACP methyl ester carboxylesterase
VEAAVAGLPVSAGAPVLLGIHGMPGDWRQARVLARDLGRLATVVLPSRPGYGHTPGEVGRTPAAQAEAYVALLDLLGVEKAVALGISGGGPSAYAFAALHPDRCAGLLLCCAVAAHLMPVPRSMRVLGRLPFLWEAGAVVDRRRSARQVADPAALDRLIERDLSAAERTRLGADPQVRVDLEAFFADRIEAMRGVAGLRTDLRWLQGERAAGARHWPGHRLPVSVLHGSADPVVPVAQAHWYATGIPGAVLRILDGYGHAVPVTARSEVIAAAAELLALSG